MRLTFRNALQFNVQGDEVYNAAIEVTRTPISNETTTVLSKHLYYYQHYLMRLQHVLRYSATVTFIHV
jgi:hypothetical protein